MLGALARNDKNAERLRDTVLTWLRHDMMYTTTAEAMLLHKNTIKYRKLSAEALIGRPIADNRIDVHLALTACAWLGAAVLA